MRKSAIIRIILWSVVALILIGILISGMSGSFFHFNIGNYTTYDDEDTYQVGNASLDATNLDSIDINWIDGSVKLETYDGDKIVISEDYTGKEEDLLRYRIENGRLTVQYRASKGYFKSISKDCMNKKLTVSVPASCILSLDKLGVDTVSSNVSVKELNALKLEICTISAQVSVKDSTYDNINIDTVSGDVNLVQTTSDTIECDTISGDIVLDGSFTNIETDTTSGNLRAKSTVAPQRINCDSVSGDFKLEIPDNNGFTATYDSVSGDINTDFTVTRHDEKSVYGDGSYKYSFDTGSGDCNITKITSATVA